MSVIRLKGITKVYGFGEAATQALDDIDLEINKGEFVAIMGPSGSGKSTLMNIVGLLDRPTGGEYKLDKEDVSRVSSKDRALLRRKKIGFVFQSFNLLARLTAIDNVALPLTYRGLKYETRMKRAEKMLTNVGLADRQYYYPNQLSGGQVQRVAIARALINHPALVLADEPTGNLDSASGKSVMEVLREIHADGNTVVVVTHDEQVAGYAQRHIHMKDGKIDRDEAVGKKAKAAKADKPKKKSTKKKKSGKRKSRKKKTTSERHRP